MGKPAPVDVQNVDTPHQLHPQPTYTPPSPSIALLFSYCTRRDALLGVLPAVIVSLAAGGIAPFMTHVIGQAFQAMAAFTTADDPHARQQLNHTMGIVALQLIGLAFGTLAFSSLMSSIWLWVGERIVMRLRHEVFLAVTSRDIEWFDLLGENKVNQDDESVGAGGLMAKFARDTEDVRVAVSLTMGMLIEYTATFFTALILAFARSWSLTLVVLASVPLMMVVQIISQGVAGPAYNAERKATASAATRIERAVASIPTVKAFNASNIELSAASKLIDASVTAYRKCAAVWAGASGISQFVLFGMFVQGFWYGTHLVHTGKASAGTVMSVFWACVIASSNLQMIMPLLVVLTKGKSAMVSLQEMIHPPPSPPKPYDNPQGKQSQDSILPTYYESVSSAPTLTHSTNSSSAPKQTLRPARCLGTFDIPAGLMFSYASRPDAPPALNISPSTPIHVAGADLTFFVGGSGSGKSTLAQLFMQLYRPDRGTILMDELPLRKLDRLWVRRHVALVSQECILFDKSVHDNVALGKLSLAEEGEEITVTREEVESACRVAMVHDFVRDLPDAYNTMLGTGGASLSGGQRQRVALARAILRDPSVLILDEATSALDTASRVLVFEAIKRHRRKKTTIVITHDLSQITDEDYVYVMKAGRVVEEGFRADLVVVKPTPVVTDVEEIILGEDGSGEFRRMLDKQLRSGGFPIRDVPDIYENARAEASDLLERALSPDSQNNLLAAPGADIPRPTSAMSKRQSTIMWAPTVLSGANTATTSHAGPSKERAPIPSAFARHETVPWQVDAMQDILGPSNSGAQGLSRSTSSKMPESRIRGRYTSRGKSLAGSDEEDLIDGYFDDDDETVHNSSGDEDDTKTPIHANNMALRSRLHRKNTSTSSLPTPTSDRAEFGQLYVETQVSPKRQSMTFEPWIYPSTPQKDRTSFQVAMEPTREESEQDHDSAIAYVVDDDDFEDERIAMQNSAAQVHSRRQNPITVVVHDSSVPTEEKEQVPSLISVIRQFYSTVPRKPWIALGLLFAVIDGALTPVFSWALAQLMAEMGTDATNYHTSTKYGLMVLLVALGNGVATGAKFYLLEDGAMRWVAGLRKTSFARILRQDKTWFDESKHSPDRMVQVIVKDGDDARTLIATVAGQTLVVFTMITLGIGWALVIGWQLTLVGLAIGPFFALAMMGQSVLTGRFELKNKRAREDVARRYYEVVANIRAIRSMALENVFSKHFEDSLETARSTGVHGAFAAGLSYGVSQALIYLTEALLFWVGAKFIANGTYTYLRLVEVLDLLIFSVSIGGQMMTFVPLISKSKQAAADFGKLLTLDLYNAESRGLMRFPIKGDITLEDVHFAYASRPDVPVLRGVNGVIREGECVAIVGASGCGKSTIGSLLQRLYEPAGGRISIGGLNIADADVAWLRDHVAVVSQHPMLFDTSIAENITYGSDPGRFTAEDIERAARAANLDDFIQTLPNGYETTIGEKAALLSGGQAQRLQIARALVNGRAQVMVFDECTSALDSGNQAAVMDTIMSVKEGRTTLLITHKVPVMQMCDRILVVDEGRVVEEGTFDELIEKRGTFQQLASAGEWACLD